MLFSQLEAQILPWFIKVQIQHELLLQYSQPSPNHHEINEFLSTLTAYFPHIDPEEVVLRLYTGMNQTNDAYIVPPSIYDSIESLSLESNQLLQLKLQNKVKREDNFSEDQDNQASISVKQSLKLSSRKGNVSQQRLKKYDLPNVVQPFFKCQDDIVTYNIKKVIIQAFIANGYGMVPFRAYIQSSSINLKIQYKEYAGIVTSVATEAFRALQNFIKTHCGVMVESLQKQDIRILYSILLNLKDLLTDKNYKTYLLFMQSQYGLCLPNTKMTGMFAYKTYQAITKLLVTRAKEMSHIRNNDKEKISVFRQSKEQIFCRKIKENEIHLDENGYKTKQTHILKKWGPQSEQQLARLYIDQQDLLKIREKYRQIYGHLTMFEDVNLIRSYVYKMIRKSLRKAQKIVKTYVNNFTQLVKQAIKVKKQQKYLQYVLTSREFIESRILLCKFYICKQNSFDLISKIAESIHKNMDQRLGSQKSLSKDLHYI